MVVGARPSRAASSSPSSPREERAGRGPRRGETNKNAPPLPSPLLHPMEEREKSRSLMQPCLEDGRDPLAEDWDWVRPHMITLLELAREFGAEFTRAKRELGGVDFADIEQLALRLLRDPATGGRTPAAQHWRRQIDHVFVDEYQ